MIYMHIMRDYYLSLLLRAAPPRRSCRPARSRCDTGLHASREPRAFVKAPGHIKVRWGHSTRVKSALEPTMGIFKVAPEARGEGPCVLRVEPEWLEAMRVSHKDLSSGYFA